MSWLLTYNTLVVLAGVSLLGASAGLIGCFAVLRRRSLTGDALAHAALPGLCAAYLVLGERSLPAMLLGAFVSGVLGVATITALRRFTRIKEDAAIGIVLSVFFGAGICLRGIIVRMEGGSRGGLDAYIFGKTAGMILEDVLLLAGLALATVFVVLLFFKEFKLVAFDPAFGRAQGWPVFVLDLLLMLLITVSVVIGLPAVGVVLMAALLILPAAAARFWTESLGRMLAIAASCGILAGVGGTFFSAWLLRMPAGPCIVLVGTVIFLVSALFAPRCGLIARALTLRRLRQELQPPELSEFALKPASLLLPSSVGQAFQPDFHQSCQAGKPDLRGR